MASVIIHYAIACELIKRKRFKDPDRLKLGSVLADAGYQGNSHLKMSVAGGHKKTYDLDGFRSRYGELMRQDDLYLGYYLHLVQDLLFRHFIYDKYHWNPLIPGNVERLHRDYAMGNAYVVRKYGLENKLVLPADFGNESVNRICSFDLDKLVREMDAGFASEEAGDIFFFTEDMADTFIEEATDYCMRITEDPDGRDESADGYLLAWNEAPRSILESTANTRDLGMYRIHGTKCYTVSDRIYRSDRCEKLSAGDKQLLTERGITTVIDLRSGQETAAKPSAFESDKDFTVLRYPVEEGMLPPDSLEEVPLSYMRIAHADCMRGVFRSIADAQGGVLIHCSAGKDRTGVVSAVLLALAGVADEDIVYDYALSREFNRNALEAFLKAHPETDREIVMANEKSMRVFLNMLREEHTSAERYLSDIGLSCGEIRTLRDKLTVR